MDLSLTYWWWGIVSYGVAHTFHIFWWRQFPVKRHLLLLGILFGFPVFALAIVGPSAVLTHLTLTAQYIAIYPAFQATSPTIEILEFLRVRGIASENEILQTCSNQSIVQDRISDLETGGLIRRKTQSFELSLRGRLLAEIFIGYRALLGLPVGEG